MVVCIKIVPQAKKLVNV